MNGSSGIKIPVLWKESFILGNIQRYVFQTLRERNFSDRLNDREEKISDALYIQLKDILAILVEIDTQHFAQQS